MKKLFIIGHRHDQSLIVDDLQEAGLLEITEVEEAESETKSTDEKLYECRAEQIGFEGSKVQFVFDFLKKAEPAKGGIIASLVKDRVLVTERQFFGIEKKIDFESIYIKCEELNERLVGLERELKHLETKKDELTGWLGLGARFDDLKSSKNVGMAAGDIKLADYEKLRSELAEAHAETDIAVSLRRNLIARLVILYYAPYKVVVERILSGFGFEEAQLDGWAMLPEEEIEKVDQRTKEITGERQEIQKEVMEMSTYIEDIMILRDWLKSRQERYATQAKFAQTNSTFILQAWAEKSRVNEIEESLGKQEAIIDFTIADPEPDDRVPVLLKNPKWLKPFEVITLLYGPPNYREFDPTPIMAGFFFLFFGLSLGDFGYGLVLTAFALWLKKRLLITETGKQWLNLFALGGIASGIVGILTGGYFSLEASAVPGFLQKFIIIDPLEQAFVFLLATWVLGVIHIVAGILIEFRNSWRNKNYADAIYYSLGKILVLLSASVSVGAWFATTVFEKDSGLVNTIMSTSLASLAITSIAFILFSGGFVTEYVSIVTGFLKQKKRSLAKDKGDIIALMVLAFFIVFLSLEMSLLTVSLSLVVMVVGLIYSAPTKRVFADLMLGLYNLYGLTSFVGDVLSYSRLMALGLATFLIGFAINTIAGLVTGFAPMGLPLGILLALLIAIPFHIFNIVINLLGAFVHPLRLQFVEFFSKFYENGGRSFEPFSFETDHLIFRKE